jgi:hypothetical protein
MNRSARPLTSGNDAAQETNPGPIKKSIKDLFPAFDGETLGQAGSSVQQPTPPSPRREDPQKSSTREFSLKLGAPKYLSK